MTHAEIMAQIESAKKHMAELAKLFPGCFDSKGRAIVASTSLPALRRPTEEKTNG